VLLHLLGVATPEELIGRFATVRSPPTFVPPAVAPRWRKTGRAACAACWGRLRLDTLHGYPAFEVRV